MAKFKAEVPLELMSELKRLEKDTYKMMGEMTQAGANVVKNNIKANAPQAIKKSPIASKLFESKVYRTPSDDGVNTKVGYGSDMGYYISDNHIYEYPKQTIKTKGKRTPIDLIIKLFEYGRHDGSFPKQPFIRKSFKRAQIQKEMLKVQDKFLPKE